MTAQQPAAWLPEGFPELEPQSPVDPPQTQGLQLQISLLDPGSLLQGLRRKHPQVFPTTTAEAELEAEPAVGIWAELEASVPKSPAGWDQAAAEQASRAEESAFLGRQPTTA